MKITYIICGALIGAGLHAGWVRLYDRTVTAEGILQHEPQQDPSISPRYPPGYFVESRIYISNANTNQLGKQFSAYGRLNSIKHPETLAYPLLTNENH